MPLFRYFFLFCLWSSGLLSVAGQQPYFKHYGSAEGLPSSELYSILEDEQGTLWIGSDRGLVRLVGRQMNLYSTAEGLPTNIVTRIVQDAQGRVWFLCFPGGLAYWDGQQIRQPELSETSRRRLLKGQIAGLFRRPDSEDLFFCLDRSHGFDPQESYNSGIYRLSKGEISRADNLFPPPAQPFSLPIIKLNHPKQLPLYEAYRKPLLSVKGLSEKSRDFLARGDSLGMLTHNDKYNSCVQLRDSSTICLCDFGYIHFQGRQVLDYKINLNENEVLVNLYQDAQNGLWLCGNQGVKYYPEGRLNSPPRAHWLKEYNVTAVSEDRQGNLWFSTHDNGLFYYPKEQPHSLILAQSPPLGILSQNIGADGRYYAAGSDNKLRRYSPDKPGQVEMITLDDRRFSSLIHDIIPLPAGILRNSKPGVLLANFLSLEEDLTFKEAFPIVQTANLRTIYSQGDSVWLLGYNQGFFASNAKGKIILNSIRDLNFSAWTEAFWLDSRNQYWIGSMNGLYRYHIHRGLDEIRQENLPALGYRIRDIKGLNERDLLFFAAHGGGLLIRYKGRWQQWQAEQSLISPNINCILTQGDSVLWLGSDRGLQYLKYSFLADSLGIRETRHYDSQNLLINNEVRNLALDGKRLLIGTANGWMWIDSHQAYACPFPRARLKQWLAGGEPVNWNSEQQLISLDNTGKHWDLELESSSSCASKILYSFFLEGQDEKAQISSRPYMRYTNLRPGYYRLRLSCAAEDRIFGPELSFYVYISPPFYQSWWFLWVGSLVLLIAAFSAYFYGARRQESKRELLQQEIRSLRAQMNPHFLFNAMNSIAFFIATNARKPALDYLAKFSRLLRKVVEHSRLHRVSWAEERELLSLYLDLEGLRLQNFSYEINLQHEETWLLPPLLLQPLVENAVLHGLTPKEGEKRLRIESLNEDEFMRIRILDNGIGRQASEAIHQQRRVQHRSSGLANIRERLKTLSVIYRRPFEIEVMDLEQGTCVMLSIPRMELLKNYENKEVS